jgi:sulfite reductase beta subunit-like hemoprotein
MAPNQGYRWYRLGLITPRKLQMLAGVVKTTINQILKITTPETTQKNLIPLR